MNKIEWDDEIPQDNKSITWDDEIENKQIEQSQPKRVFTEFLDVMKHLIPTPSTEISMQQAKGMAGLLPYEAAQKASEKIASVGVPFMQKIPIIKDIPFGARILGDPSVLPVDLPLGAILAKSAARGIAKPVSAISRTLGEGRKATQSIKELQKTFGVEGLPIQSFRERLGEVGETQKLLTRQKIQNITKSGEETIGELKNISDKLGSELQKSATGFTNFMKDKFPQWARTGSEKYGNMLDQISDMVKSPILASEVSDMTGNIIQKATEEGLSGPILNDLVKINASYANLSPANEIPLSTLKTTLGRIWKHTSPQFKAGQRITQDDIVSSMVKDEWGDFVGRKLPEEGMELYNKMQSYWKPFSQAKKEVGKMFHPYSGEFDMSKGINTALQIAKGKVNEGTQKLFDMLENGIEGFVSGIEGIGGKRTELLKISEKIGATKATVPIIQRSVKLNKQLISQELDDFLGGLFKTKNKLAELEAMKARSDRIKTSAIRIIGGLTGLGILTRAVSGVSRLKDVQR